MYTIRKSFKFEMAHQLETAFTAACHECVHGHSYTVELFVGSTQLNRDHMVVDFSELKEFKDAVMAAWDHGLLLHHSKSKWYGPMIEARVLKREKVCFVEWNPTAEGMATFLLVKLQEFLKRLFPVDRVWAIKVRVHETSTGWAECNDAVGIPALRVREIGGAE